MGEYSTDIAHKARQHMRRLGLRLFGRQMISAVVGASVQDPRSALARGSLTVLSVRVTSLLLMLALQVVLARLLGISEYGVFMVAFSWLTILGIVARSGLDNGLTRLVAEYRSQELWSRLKGVLIWALKAASLGSICIAILASIVVWMVPLGVIAGNESTFWAAFIALPFLALGTLRQGALRGFRHVGRADIPELIVRPAFMLVALSMFAAFLATLSSTDAMVLTVASYMIAFGLGSLYLSRAIPSEVRQALPEFRVNEWLRISLPLMFIQGMQVVLSRIDTVMLGVMTGPVETGAYSAAAQIATVVTFGLMIVNPIAAPLIAELYHRGKARELQSVVTLAARVTTVVMIASVIILVPLGSSILGLFGVGFDLGYTALLILLVGQVANALTGSVGFIMAMTGHQNQSALILAATVCFNIALNSVLIPRYGLNGAAIATAVSISISNGVMFTYVLRVLKIRSTIF